MHSYFQANLFTILELVFFFSSSETYCIEYADDNYVYEVLSQCCSLNIVGKEIVLLLCLW